ncbi:MAG: cardiolipin synthase [Oscillospiraceae bacterium]
MKKILRFLTSRLFIFGICIFVQVLALVLMVLFLSQYGFYMYGAFTLMSFITILYVVSKKDNPIFKLAWVTPIALFPLLGWFIYYLAGKNKISKIKVERFKSIYKLTKSLTVQDETIINDLKENHCAISKQVTYIKNTSFLPIYKNTITEYLSPGETFFKRLCEELEKAEKFIFMEYFIIQKGEMWDRILDILAKKVAHGVEVKMMYDDLGCINTVPTSYYKKIRDLGIAIHVFNVFKPSIDTFMNYRDHRKITVIDGNVGFTGGINLADEYINLVDRFGYWKDSSIMLKGEAVWSLSVLFLQMWQYYDYDDINYQKYRPTEHCHANGYVMPFGDGPLDDHLIGEMVYINMINNARNYISITTPYLILDNEMITSLCCAAHSGIKVSIITPGNADKWYVHLVTRYNYQTLVEAGVEIFEYTGGFIHAKTVVCDDELAIVGTQNFDFRSFYLHFECGVFLHNTDSIAAIRKDHIDCFVSSKRITLDECRNENWFVRVLQSFLNLFSPLM